MWYPDTTDPGDLGARHVGQALFLGLQLHTTSQALHFSPLHRFQHHTKATLP